MSLPALLGGSIVVGLAVSAALSPHIWCARILFQSPAAVRFRNRRRKKQIQPHIRTQQQQFFWAVSFGSIGSSTWFPTFFTLPLRMEGITPQSAARPRSSHRVSFPSSPSFSSRPGSGCDIYVAWLSGASHAHALRDVAASTQVSKYLDTPVPVSFLRSSRTFPMTSCEASNSALGLATQSSSSLLFPLLVWFVVLPGRWARGRRVLHFSRLSHLVFRRNAVSFLVLIPRCLLVFARETVARLVSLIVLVWQSSVRVHVRFLMVLVTELHTLRQCGVRASLVRVS